MPLRGPLEGTHRLPKEKGGCTDPGDGTRAGSGQLRHGSPSPAGSWLPKRGPRSALGEAPAFSPNPELAPCRTSSLLPHTLPRSRRPFLSTYYVHIPQLEASHQRVGQGRLGNLRGHVPALRPPHLQEAAVTGLPSAPELCERLGAQG